MMLYKNMNVKVHSLDGDADTFNTIAGFLQEDTLASYRIIISRVYGLQMSINLMKENGFTLEKERSRWYSTQTITDIDYTDDIMLLASTPAQVKSLLHSLEQAAGLHVNADKTEYMCFNQNQSGDIFTLNGGSLKLVDMVTYRRRSISSMENDINTWLVKA